MALLPWDRVLFSEPFSDTNPRALEVWLALQRGMAAAQKAEIVFQLSDLALRLSQAGVRRQYPAASEREVFLLTAARHLDRGLMRRAYGWDPELYDGTGSGS